MTKNTDDVPGIGIRAFPLNEVQVKCMFTLTFSDAIDLFRKTSVGLPANPDFREWFMNKLEHEIHTVLREKGKLND